MQLGSKGLQGIENDKQIIDKLLEDLFDFKNDQSIQQSLKVQFNFTEPEN